MYDRNVLKHCNVSNRYITLWSLFKQQTDGCMHNCKRTDDASLWGFDDLFVLSNYFKHPGRDISPLVRINYLKLKIEIFLFAQQWQRLTRTQDVHFKIK